MTELEREIRAHDKFKIALGTDDGMPLVSRVWIDIYTLMDIIEREKLKAVAEALLEQERSKNEKDIPSY